MSIWFKGHFKWILSFFLVGIILVLGSFLLCIKPLAVSGTSMENTLKNHERIFVNKMDKPDRYSIIAFKIDHVDPDSDKGTINVKRVIGVPGDTISYTRDGNLYVNGNKVDQKFVTKKNQKQGTLSPEISNVDFESFNLKKLSIINQLKDQSNKVPKDSYFVMGDNRSESYDSRFYGYVPKSDVIGTVIK